jgi:hypothetical protein
MKKLIIIPVVFLLLCACDTPEPQKPNYTPAQQLAMISSGKYIDDSDILVKRFQYLLNSIQKSTGYDHPKIAAMIVKASEMLRNNYGKEVNVLEIAEAVYQSKSVENKSTNLETYLSMYVVFVGQ